MSVVNELINAQGESLEFGNYELGAKTKKDGFEFQGDIYKIKTFNEITKLEKNGMFVYESVPGTAVHGFKASKRYPIDILRCDPQRLRAVEKLHDILVVKSYLRGIKSRQILKSPDHGRIIVSKNIELQQVMID